MGTPNTGLRAIQAFAMQAPILNCRTATAAVKDSLGMYIYAKSSSKALFVKAYYFYIVQYKHRNEP